MVNGVDSEAFNGCSWVSGCVYFDVGCWGICDEEPPTLRKVLGVLLALLALFLFSKTEATQ